MSVIEHLEALRRALMIAMGAWAVTTVIAFFISGQVIGFLVKRAGIGHAVYFGPAGGILTELQVAIYIGFVLAAPVVIQQTWWFVSPGLHRHERRFILPVLVATIFFFALGVAAAIFAMPLYISVLSKLAPPNVTYLADISQLIGFVLSAGGFGEQPTVLNGASDLLVEVLGAAGKHTRAALGTNSLPMSATVEIAAVAVVRTG